jgi:hypothetical protein
MSTTYGFGTPIATIKVNGGDAKHALKVSCIEDWIEDSIESNSTTVQCANKWL